MFVFWAFRCLWQCGTISLSALSLYPCNPILVLTRLYTALCIFQPSRSHQLISFFPRELIFLIRQ